MTSPRTRLRATALAALQGALGILLLGAGFSKLLSAASFAESIGNYHLLPPQANQFLAVALPWWEATAGLLLLFRLWTRAAALVGTLLFGAFSIAVASALFRHLDISCGCLGTSSGTIVGWKVLAVDLCGLSASVLTAWTAAPPGIPKEPKTSGAPG